MAQACRVDYPESRWNTKKNLEPTGKKSARAQAPHRPVRIKPWMWRANPRRRKICPTRRSMRKACQPPVQRSRKRRQHSTNGRPFGAACSMSTPQRWNRGSRCATRSASRFRWPWALRWACRWAAWRWPAARSTCRTPTVTILIRSAPDACSHRVCCASIAVMAGGLAGHHNAAAVALIDGLGLRVGNGDHARNYG